MLLLKASYVYTNRVLLETVVERALSRLYTLTVFLRCHEVSLREGQSTCAFFDKCNQSRYLLFSTEVQLSIGQFLDVSRADLQIGSVYDKHRLALSHAGRDPA